MSKARKKQPGYLLLLADAIARLGRAEARLTANPGDEYARKEVAIAQRDVEHLRRLAAQETRP